MRETFYTDGKDLLEPNGKKVLLRGVNKMSVWDENDPTGASYFAEIGQTQANSVRIVWAITKDLKPDGEQTDLDTLDALITNARKHQLIPMIELHDATGDWERLQKLVDYWIQPKVVELIQKHQAYLLVNIGNEVGDDTVKQNQFISVYKYAVKRMRDAGIHVPLVIDASGWGKDLDILNATADKLIQADTDKNLVFSVHTYWPISDGADADFIQSKLDAAAALTYPLIVGEFSKYGGFAGQDEQGQPRSICGEFGEIDYQTILNVCNDKGIGWYAWEWGPGNAVTDPLCAAMDMTPDGRFDHLKAGWATDVVNSIEQAAKSQNYFRLEPIPEPSPLQIRIETLKAVLSDPSDQSTVSEALQTMNGDWSKTLANLTEKKALPTQVLQKLTLAHSLAVWSDDQVAVVKTLANAPSVTSLRDVALHFNVEKLTALVDPHAVPENTPGATLDAKKKNIAIALQNKLFTVETTAVLQRMVQDAEVPIVDTKLRSGVVSFLDNQPDFNIRTTSIYTALKHPEAFKDIAEEQRSGVVEQLKTLQRVQAISPIPEAVPVLMQANLTSAFRVAEIPESTFLSAHSTVLGEEAARQVYTSAINTHIRNTHALRTIQETLRGPGLAIMGGQQPMETRMAAAQALANEKGIPLNLEALFGSIDFCECDDCLSVYSPAAYFVDILQYLRNNDLGPNPPAPTQPNPNIHPGIKDTPLEKLFRRRPDLGCLELTCENTFTVLPYIDLVNEVMESFVVHLDKYDVDPNVPKQATLEVFNVLDEITSELLAQPQHINYQAYCILKDAIYPFTLPYHQPIDAIRIWLKYLGTSRYELLDTFRTANEAASGMALAPAQQQELQTLHTMVLDRSADAEFLGITQEEHIILTREAFWPKAYFDLTLQKVHTDDEYQKKIGVRQVCEYYGYSTDAEMLDLNEDAVKGQKGLTFVKKQFLPRTGIQYVDLVELLKTRFINPAFPQGRALAILESIRFSYRFLQTLVDTNSTDRKVRFARLIEFLNNSQMLVPQINYLLRPDPCHQQNPEHCLAHTDFHNWVYCYFERIGKLIVLESGEGPQLPFEGKLFGKADQFIGTLHKDGTILDTSGKTIIGHVNASITPIDNRPIGSAGPVETTDGKPFVEQFEPFSLRGENNATGGIFHVTNEWLYWSEWEPVKWLPARDTCNLDKVRLTHLDGSILTAEEYDRMQRFIRLWHKLGWTIDETDHALIGLSTRAYAEPGDGTTTSSYSRSVGFDMFQSDCITVGDGDKGGCDDTPEPNDNSNCPKMASVPENISTDFLHQLVAIQKLLDLTGLPLDKLLSFWADISTAGEKSLYARLFLTHNLLGIDKVFKSDANGNYLTQPAKLSEHMPVLMAALKLKADDITSVMAFRQLSDALTLANVSVLYRHSLLAKILHVRVADLAEVTALLGDPFKSAQDTLALLQDWGNIEDTGITFRQLNYLIRNHDDTQRPLAPAKQSILQISKTLYDGLNAIDHDHADVSTDQPDQATADLIRAKAGLLYEASVVEQIISLLEGTSVYTTNAPPNQVIALPDTDALAKKLKYSNQKDAIPPSASIQVIGILTDAEKAQAKTLSNDTGWAKSVDRVGKQARQFFNNNLLGIFPATGETTANPRQSICCWPEGSGILSTNDEPTANLLAGDINVSPDPKNPAATDANTAPAKRFYFLQFFLPFLRQRLAHRLIVDTLAGAASLTSDITDALLSDVLLVGDSKPACHRCAGADPPKTGGEQQRLERLSDPVGR